MAPNIAKSAWASNQVHGCLEKLTSEISLSYDVVEFARSDGRSVTLEAAISRRACFLRVAFPKVDHWLPHRCDRLVNEDEAKGSRADLIGPGSTVAAMVRACEIGRAYCRDRGWQYV